MSKIVGTLSWAPGEPAHGYRKAVQPRWVIQALPHVMMRLKRIFPRVQVESKDRLYIVDNPQTAREIEWVLGMFPLDMDAETAERLQHGADAYREREQAVNDILGGNAGRPPMLLGEPGMTPREYQTQYVNLLAQVERLLLGDGTGVGKTITAGLGFALPDALPALVVMPTHLPAQWTRKMNELWPMLSTHTLKGTKPYDFRELKAFKGHYPDILLTPYSRISGWSHALAGQVRTVVFDEVDALRTGKTSEKGRAAGMLSEGARYVAGMSVGPDSTVELVGGPFGDGWSGRIEDATTIVEPHAIHETHGTETVLRTEHLGIKSRGWTGEGFAWKSVKSFIRHARQGGMTEVRTTSGPLLFTNDHSVYKVTDDGLVCVRAHALRKGDVLAIDNGADWKAGTVESLIDMPSVVASYDGAQVTVDLSGVTRHELGMNAWQWQNSHREGKYGTRLPVRRYLDYADLLPAPTSVYRHGDGARRMDATVRLSDFAYILGFYLGDGWVSGTRVEFAVEKALVPKILDELEALSGIDLDPLVSVGRKGSDEIRCGQPMLAWLLRNQLGDSHKCHQKAIPGGWITTWPESARRRLLEGLIDSDGSVGARGRRRTYTTTSMSLAMSLLALLRSLGVKGGLWIGDPRIGGIVDGRQIVARRAVYRVHWSAFAEDGDDRGGSPVAYPWTRGRLLEAPVRSVSPVGENPPECVYDLEMEGHPSFVASGVLVHNSATPAHNFGGEFWSLYDIISPGALGSREEFLREWASYGTYRDGRERITDPAAFGTYLREQGLLLARTRKDVGLELGAAPVVEVETVGADSNALSEASPDIAQIAALILSPETAQQQRFVAGGQFDWRWRQATGVAKAPYVAEYLRLLLESEDKVVVYAWHRAVLDVLMDRLREFRPVLYTGSESPKQKDESQAQFMTPNDEGGARVMIISLQSGSGLDGLQDVCSAVVFAELDWSPAVHKQGIDRIHRPGQKSPVLVVYLVSEDGSDPVIAETLDLKEQNTTPVVDPDGALFELKPGAVVDGDRTSRMRGMAEAWARKHAPHLLRTPIKEAA